MRSLLIPFLFIFIFILVVVFGELSKSDPDIDSRNLPSTLEPTFSKNDTIIMAAPDGTIYLADNSTGKVFGSFSSGPPIYSSYQQLPDHESKKLNVSADADNPYIDFGEDWKLYWHKTGHKIEKLPSAEELIKNTPFVTAGGIVIGSKRTSVFLVDAKTGEVVRTVRSDDFPSSMEQGTDTSLFVRKDVEETISASVEDIDALEKSLYITRTDYSLKCNSLQTGKVLWHLMFANVEASFQCEGVENILGGVPLSTEFIPIQRLHMEFSTHCESGPAVIHIRGRGSLESFFANDGVQDTRPEGSVVSSPSPYHNPMLEAMGNLLLLHHKNKNKETLALPTSEPEESVMKSLPSGGAAHLAPQMSGHAESDSFVQRTGWSTMLYSALVPTAMAVLFYIIRYVVARRRNTLNKKHEDKDQNAVPKKRKGRKSGVSKKSLNAGKICESDEQNGVVRDTDGVENLLKTNSLPQNLSDNYDTSMDRRKVGKLIVTNKVIARGSNGTIVLEGNYDGRSVAVKRLVRTHHDVAVKEIQNLIASDQHPNIVRWYGVEYDQDFVYLSLERCTCSLHELIIFCTSTNQITNGDQECEYSSFSCNTQLLTLGNEELYMWKDNGYPSTELLKLMRDIVCGLAHLHELGIIHRDLKPQNVLVIKGRLVSAKISDMGISKRLDGEVLSLTKHASGYGSSGWQAPEQLRHERQTRAIDLFSLGCILFFCITGGKHPYGESLERDMNILNNRKDLFLIDHIPEAIDLVSKLLDPLPDLRPKAVEVLHHPMFWNSETRLSFLRDVSDRIELEDRENASQLLEALESRGKLALGGKWDEKMDNTFINDIGRYRRYKFDSVRDLLRVVRNKLNHYRELSQEIQALLGSVPEGFDLYFSSRFPNLLIEVYTVVLKHCADEAAFLKYFRHNRF